MFSNNNRSGHGRPARSHAVRRLLCKPPCLPACMNPLMIRDVFERTPQPSIKSVDVGLSDKKTGFPAAHHRLAEKGSSTFKRARQQQRPVQAASPRKTAELTSPDAEVPEHSMKQSYLNDVISTSADTLFAEMTDEERAQGREEILEYFGDGMLDTMGKLQQVRNRRRANLQSPAPG